MLEDMRYFVDYVNKYRDQVYLRKLSLQLEEVVIRSNPELPPRGVQKAVVDRIYYILLRFGYWSHSQIFRDSVVDYFIQDYGVSRIFIDPILNPLFGISMDYYEEFADFCGSDKEFIRYVFVECATQQNETDLERNLGIGGYLINKIKKAVDVASAIHQSGATAPLLFLPHLDSMVSDILYEMQEDCLKNPFKISLFRLRYSILNSLIFRPHIEDFNFIDKLFDFLLVIGDKDSLSYLISLKTLGKKFSKSHQNIHPAQVFDELVRCGLVYISNGASPHGEVRLTTKSQEITAEVFVNRLIHVGIPSEKTIGRLNIPYQMAFFGSDSLELTTLRELILNCRPLAPQVLEVALNSLMRRANTALFTDTLALLKGDEKAVFLSKVPSRFDKILTRKVVEVDQERPIVPEFEQLFSGQEAL